MRGSSFHLILLALPVLVILAMAAQAVIGSVGRDRDGSKKGKLSIFCCVRTAVGFATNVNRVRSGIVAWRRVQPSRDRGHVQRPVGAGEEHGGEDDVCGRGEPPGRLETRDGECCSPHGANFRRVDIIRSTDSPGICSMDGVIDGSGPAGVGGPQRPLPALLQRRQRLRRGS